MTRVARTVGRSGYSHLIGLFRPIVRVLCTGGEPGCLLSQATPTIARTIPTKWQRLLRATVGVTQGPAHLRSA